MTFIICKGAVTSKVSLRIYKDIPNSILLVKKKINLKYNVELSV